MKRRQSRMFLWTVATALAACFALPSPATAGEPVDGFLAPFRTVEVATAETGILREVLVQEGGHVGAGQILVRIDDELYTSLLAIAEKATQSEGKLAAAEAELHMREQRLAKLQELLSRGSARAEELERAQADADIAAAQWRAVKEDLALKHLEYERARLQLERRTIVAPLAGVVLRLNKEIGEFVGVSDPDLMTIVQLDPLLAVFAVPSSDGRRMQVGQAVRLRLPEAQTVVTGIVHLVAPVVDGKSGTMRVEVRIENPDGRLLSGEPCSLLLPADGATNTGPTPQAD